MIMHTSLLNESGEAWCLFLYSLWSISPSSCCQSGQVIRQIIQFSFNYVALKYNIQYLPEPTGVFELVDEPRFLWAFPLSSPPQTFAELMESWNPISAKWLCDGVPGPSSVHFPRQFPCSKTLTQLLIVLADETLSFQFWGRLAHPLKVIVSRFPAIATRSEKFKIIIHHEMH